MKDLNSIRLWRLFCGLLFTGPLGAAVRGQTAAEPASGGAIRDSFAVQKARNEHVRGRAKKAFYTRAWNLDDLPPYAPEHEIFGSLRMWGSNYLFDGNLGRRWEEGFRKYHKNVTFADTFKTPAAALPALYTLVADIGVGTYNFSSLEAYQRHFNFNPLEVRVMTGSFDVPGWSNALCIFVNQANPLTKLTIKQLDRIFGSARSGGWVGTEWHPEFARGSDQNIRTWGQLGLTGEWADKPIHVYGNNLRYGQATFFSDRVLKSSDKWNEDLRMYANYVRPDGSFAIGAALLIADLGKDRYGIAYSGAQNLSPETKMLPLAVQDGGPYVMPSIDTVRDRSYPLAYDIFMYANRVPNTPLDPKVKEYLKYVLSREGQAEVVRDGKYLPLTGEMVREELKKLE